MKQLNAFTLADIKGDKKKDSKSQKKKTFESYFLVVFIAIHNKLNLKGYLYS